MAEKLFRDARQYFYKLSRDVESQKSISAELGENIFYTDDELYSIVVSKSRSQYNVSSPSLLPPETKMEFARMLHFEYHANNKQIARMLRLDRSFVESFFPESR
jgi:hypothetical protein